MERDKVAIIALKGGASNYETDNYKKKKEKRRYSGII